MDSLLVEWPFLLKSLSFRWWNFSAPINLSSLWFKILPCFLNFMFLNQIIFVLLLSSLWLVFKCLHDLIAKNTAPMNSHANAKSLCVYDVSIILLIAERGSAFCFLFDPSVFMYPLWCSCSIKQVLSSWSNLGPFLLFALKACATCVTVVATIPSTKCVLFPLEKVPSLTAWPNPEMILFFCCPENLSRNKSPTPMLYYGGKYSNVATH